jgi:senataxin
VDLNLHENQVTIYYLNYIQVYFHDNFKISISRIRNAEIRSAVLSLLAKLTSGWRQPHERRNLIDHDGTSSELLEVYKIDRQLNLVWTVDILEEYSHHIQVIKVWDVARLSDIQKLANQLDIIFESYTVDKMHRCKYRCLEGYELI